MLPFCFVFFHLPLGSLRLYQSGNKPGRLLARLTKGRMEANTISSLQDNNRDRHYKTTDINRVVREFYQKLYSSEYSSSDVKVTEFLGDVTLPRLTDGQQEALGAPISQIEVREAIASLKGGKAPGPDGFCPEFYKTLSHLVVGPLTDMLRHSFERGGLPPTLNLANINLILKKDKPPDICGSYRPISLIGVDSKLLSKILATRLEKLMTFLINPDQTGFIQNRFSFTNMRRLLNVIQYASQTNCRAFAVSLDAEKAFDRIEWKYLFNVLERFGIGGDFLKWIKILYSSPSACVLTNGVQSPPFTIHRGTRQGCPLSPLLFALALEPLAVVIRSQQNVHGVIIDGKIHKIALYADDILLFVTKPDISIPAILSTIHEFGSCSGYKINFDKSEAMPLGIATVRDLPSRRIECLVPTLSTKSAESSSIQ
uniref:Reverse transcriptase domain-containing protein n=1 Tax=Kryptolebias marmoratus TaxID=37003 RepID=A0A3Q3ASG7_KRYMA